MNETDDYPLAPILAGLRTVTGRVVLVFVAGFVGVMFGGITATREVGGAWAALGSFPEWAAMSFLVSGGIIAFPGSLLFALVFARSAWPLWTVGVVTLLMWWNAHKTLYWLLHESVGAKIQQIVAS